MRLSIRIRYPVLSRLFLALLLSGWISAASADSLATEDFWVANGPVHATATDGTTLYLGGDFSYVGPVTGSGMAVRLLDGSNESAMPKVEGTVHVVIPDGSGGWYIGGLFTSVGGLTRNNVAHIRANNSVNSAFDPGTNNAVLSLALSSDLGTLYVGGDFTSIGGVSRRHLGAVDTGNGVVVPGFNPHANATVRALALSSDDATLYAGGEFTDVNSGTPRNRLAAFAATSGTAIAGFDPDVNNTVHALALSADDNTLYAGGSFTTVNVNSTPAARNRVAAFDADVTTPSATLGDATAFDPDINGTVRTLALSSDDVALYAGGDFTAVNGGTAINRLAAFTTADGVVVGAFNPDINNVVRTLRLRDDSTLFAGGDFTDVNGGTVRTRLAEFATADGVTTDWNPLVGDTVRSIALSSTLLYAGGDFNSIGGVLRERLAALTIADGTATGWDPGADDIVRTLLLSDSADVLYAGGDFTNVGGELRGRLAALDTTTDAGSALGWNPLADQTVHAMTLNSAGTALYVAGEFTDFNGISLSGIGLARFTVDGDTEIPADTPDGWDPAPDGPVYALALEADDTTIFVGGDFQSIGSNAAVRSRLASLRTTTAAATVWDHGADAPVRALALSHDGNTLYAGGEFDTVSNESRVRLASIGTSPPVGTEWTVQTSGTTSHLRGIAASSSRFVAVGDDATILTSDDGSDWDPVESEVAASLADVIFTGLNQFVAVGSGGFVITSQNGTSWVEQDSTTQSALNGVVWGAAGAEEPLLVAVGSGGTVITSTDGAEWTEQSSPTGVTLNDIDVSGVDISTGQGIGFLAVGDNGTVITSEDGVTWMLENSGVAADLNAVFWTGSNFIAVGDGGTIITRTNSDNDSWVQVPVSTTQSLTGVTFGLSRYVAVGTGGTIITSADSATWDDQEAVTGQRLSAVNSGSGRFIVVGDNGTILTSIKNDSVNEWTPNANGTVRTLIPSSDDATIYAGGDFSTIGLGNVRRRLASLRADDGEARAWNPDLDGAVLSMSFVDEIGTLFAGGSFATVGSESRGGIASFDLLPPVSSVTPDPGDSRGLYNESQTITLECDDGSGSGCAAIYASIDGSVPPISDVNLYTEPVSISSNTTLRFRAVDNVGNIEEVQSRQYVIDVTPPVTIAIPSPTATGEEEGNFIFYDSSLLVALSCDDTASGSGCSPGGTFYTVDGSTPTILSNVYTGPITIRESTVVKYFSMDNVGNQEQVKQQSYVRGGDSIGALGPLALLLLAAAVAVPGGLRRCRRLRSANAGSGACR